MLTLKLLPFLGITASPTFELPTTENTTTESPVTEDTTMEDSITTEPSKLYSTKHMLHLHCLSNGCASIRYMLVYSVAR